MASPTNVFGYIRVSTQRQGQHGASLQEQRDAVSRYAQRHGLTIVEWFEERETAAKYGRRVFSRMLRLLKRGRAAGVIIHKIDRSARNLKDWADLGELIDAGIDVHFAHESLDLHSRGGRLAADIQAVVAADYVRNLKDEVRKGFVGRLKQGVYPLPAPVGYLDMGKGIPKKVDPKTAPLVKSAFELYATGRYNLDTLLAELHRRGLRNRNGKPFSRSGLSWLLNNPFYYGVIYIRRTGDTYAGAHQPIVTKKLFDRVHDVLNGRFNARHYRHDFLFARLLQCGLCSYSLSGERQKGRVYYRCHTKGCPTKGIREEAVDQAIRSLIAQLQFTDRQWEAAQAAIAKMRNQWQERRHERVDALQLKLENLKSRSQRLTDSYLDALLDKDAYQERRTELLSEIAAVEQSLAEIQAGGSAVPDAVSKFLERAKMACFVYDSGSAADKREIVESVTSNRSLQQKNLYVELQIPFTEVAKYTKLQCGGPFRNVPRTFPRPSESFVESLYEHFFQWRA